MVEVQDKFEWEFLIDFIEYHSGGFGRLDCSAFYGAAVMIMSGDTPVQCPIYLGLDYSISTHSFYYRTSGKPAEFLKLSPGNYDRGNATCVMIDPAGGNPGERYNMTVGVCFGGYTKYPTSRTVCEVDGS